MRIWLLLWLVLILAQTNPFSIGRILVSGQCLGDQQKSLLLELKNSLNFNASLSAKLVTWNQSNDSWDGVTCGGGRFTGLDLSFESITGGLNDSSSLFRLNNLQRLNLAYNRFPSLEIPSGFGNLINLVYLNLSNAGFAGQVPIGISRLTRLRGQTLPLPPHATYMDFSSNNFTLVIPLAIGTSLSTAIFFSLSNNNFQGFIPESICEAGYLEVLDLSHNNLTGSIPDCLVMESLKVLNLRDNALDGSIINFPEHCGLKTLDLSSNRLQGKFPKSLANCTNLEVLDVGNNQIDDVYPCELKSIASLRVLVLRSNKFHGGVGCVETNGTWKMLQIVDVSSNNFSGTLPAQYLRTWEAMKANVDINDIQYPFLRLTGLYYQDTVSVTIKGLQVELMKILTLYTIIDFSCNNLEGPIPDTLGDLKALYVLNLSNNGFSGPIPPSLGHLQQLESLDLSRNDLNGTIPRQLSDLNFLSSLNLSYNKLVGSIPAVKQFLTFTASSFEGNAGLCGPPLETICFPLKKTCSIATNGTEEAGCVPTESDTDDKGDNDDSESKWFYMGIPLGFVVGFWVFCGPLAFIRSWRLAYYRFWDKVSFGH
ncbi:receptor-like protein 43 isoform X2 [Syzygium oleosum]|uniref:receptor-like protein 43 isoform X2 n=1 Tax=Syzygium oleosum TaxID=219896 RepID=UPI0024B9B367|nr:receptor-like protein 43 isoform X2 [Syzygium oleosum]